MNMLPVVHGIDPEDVKEFIKELKERLGDKCNCIQTDPDRKGQCWMWDIIDKLVGEKLI